MDRIALKFRFAENPFHHLRNVERAEFFGDIFINLGKLIGEKTEPYSGDRHHRALLLDALHDLSQIFLTLGPRQLAQKVVAA